MWSSVFDPIKFDWFYLEWLGRSSRQASREKRLKTDFGSNADFHMSRIKRIIHDNQSEVMLMYESASISVFSNMAAYRGGFEDEDDEDCWMLCLETTKYRYLRCKFPLCNKCSLPEENDEIPGSKAGKFVAYCVPCSKEAFERGT